MTSSLSGMGKVIHFASVGHVYQQPPQTTDVDPSLRNNLVTQVSTVVSRPSIVSIFPTSVPNTGGSLLTINGNNFFAGASVYIGTTQVPQQNITSVTSSMITCFLPAISASNYTVAVRNTDYGPPTGSDAATYSALHVTAPPSYGAEFVTQSVPAVMAAGQTYPVSVTMTNTGAQGWTQAGQIWLGSNPQNNMTWGASRIDLGPMEGIGSGASKTFTFNVTAPTPGTYPATYNFQWRMVRFDDMNGNIPFGMASTNVAVQVVAPTRIPSGISVSPATGGGAAQIFRTVVRDIDGASDLRAVGFLVQASGGGAANAAYLWYDPATASLQLLTDSGGPGTPVPIGSANILTNSQCSVDVSATAATLNGNDLTLSIPIAFKSGFNGSKNVSVYPVDSLNLTPGWQQLGTFTVAAASDPTPAVLSVTPVEGSNASQLFHVRISDPTGALNINQMMLLFQTARAGTATAVYVQPQPGFHNVFLSNDAGGWYGPVTLGGDPLQFIPLLENAESVVDPFGVHVAQDGNVLDVYIPIAFKDSFNGPRSAYVWATNVSGSQTPWIPEMASFNVNAATFTTPMALCASAMVGKGVGDTFTLTYMDYSGVLDLKTLYFLINDRLAGDHALYVKIDGWDLYLRNDGDTAWQGPVSLVTPGGGPPLANTQGTVLAGNGSGIFNWGTDTRITLPITFNPSFAGPKTLFMWAADQGGLTTPGWQDMGTFDVNFNP